MNLEWIDIKERLPEMTERYDEDMEMTIVASDPVLVSMNGKDVKYGRFEKEGERIFFWNAPMIYNAFGEYEYELDEISHWMPFPAPAELSKEELRFRNTLLEYVHEIQYCKRVLASGVTGDALKDTQSRLEEAEKMQKKMLKDKDKLLGNKK